MLLETRSAPPFFKNGFVLGCPDTRAAVLIDPGDEVADLLAIVTAERLDVQAILLTHGHVDHVSGVARARAALGAPIHLHEADLPIYRAAARQAAFFGLTAEDPPPVDRFVQGGDVVRVGRAQLAVHHTPGHSPGGLCLQLQAPGDAPTRLFVGDTLFAGSIGRTDLPGGDHPTLLRSIREVLFSFGDAAIVHPGHGPETTIGEERRTNPFLIRTESL